MFIREFHVLQREFFSFFFLGPHPQHMEVPRLRVKSELQLPTYTTATEMQDPSRVCGLHHSSWQCWILNPQSKASDQTWILMDASQIRNLLSHNGNSRGVFYCDKSWWTDTDLLLKRHRNIGHSFSQYTSPKHLLRARLNVQTLQTWPLTTAYHSALSPPATETNYPFFFFSFFGHPHGTWKFPDQGSNLSHSSNLHHTCNNARSFTN